MDKESGESRKISVRFSRISAGKPSIRGKRGLDWGDQGVSFETHFLTPDYESITGTENSLFPNPHPAE
jgi:hypothetical protein